MSFFIEQVQNGMSDEELAPPDWRVRAGPRNKPIQKEREEHEATHVPSRDWCTHCMMGRGRTQAHVPKRKSEDPSRRPAIAMESVVNAQTISQESVTCIAVKDVRHQNIMSSVALKKESKNRGQLREWRNSLTWFWIS